MQALIGASRVSIDKRADATQSTDAELDAAARSGHQLDVLIRKARWNSTTEFYAHNAGPGPGPARRPWYQGDV